MDMKPISITEHGWNVANMVPISITKHKMIWGKICFFVNFGLISWGPKQSSSHKVFIKNGILRWWNLDNFWNSENNLKK